MAKLPYLDIHKQQVANEVSCDAENYASLKEAVEVGHALNDTSPSSIAAFTIIQN